MKNYIVILAVVLTLVSAACSKKGDQEMQVNENVILKISVFKSGEIQADSKVVSLQELDELLEANAQKNGVVWYYREAYYEEPPPPHAMEALELVVKYGRPISLSSKPDFSDTIDDKGKSRPKKRKET